MLRFDASVINNLFKLQKRSDALGNTLIKEHDKDMLEEIFNGVIWTTFIKNRLMPTTHDRTITVARVSLCHYIMKHIHIDAGAVISDAVVKMFEKKKRGNILIPLVSLPSSQEGKSQFSGREGGPNCWFVND